jgi:hypothetical protein
MDGEYLHLQEEPMPLKIISASVAFIALGLRVIGEAIVKDYSTLNTGRSFGESDKEKLRRSHWPKRGWFFIKVSTVLLLAVAGWAVVNAFLAN